MASGHLRRACGWNIAAVVFQWHHPLVTVRQTALIFRVLDSSLLDYTQWNLRGIKFSKTPRMPFIHFSTQSIYSLSGKSKANIALRGLVGFKSANGSSIENERISIISSFYVPFLFRFFGLWSLSKCWREIQMNQVAAGLVGGTENTGSRVHGSTGPRIRRSSLSACMLWELGSVFDNRIKSWSSRESGSGEQEPLRLAWHRAPPDNRPIKTRVVRREFF